MNVLSLYLLRFVTPRFVLIAFGVTAMALLLDTANNSDLLWPRGQLAAIARYASLRAPSVFVSLSVFSALIAILVALTELGRRGELVALRAAGWSQRDLLISFTPVAALMAAAYFAVSDFALPPAEQALRDWDFDQAEQTSGDSRLWLRSGDLILRARGVDADGRMSDISVFRLSDEGLLSSRTDAEAAAYRDGEWRLEGVSRDGAPTGAEEIIALPLSPLRVKRLASDPRSLSLRGLNALIGTDTFGARPPQVYRLYRQRKASQTLSVVIMLMLAVPLVQRFQRRDMTARVLVSGIALGFSYLALDSFFVALGEAGLMPIALAAWGATVLFALAALAMMMSQESV